MRVSDVDTAAVLSFCDQKFCCTCIVALFVCFFCNFLLKNEAHHINSISLKMKRQRAVAVLGLHLGGGSGVAIIAAGGARTYITTVNHP